MTETSRRRRVRYVWWLCVLLFVILPLFSVAYPLFTYCSVASVLVVNRSGHDMARAVFSFDGTPVRRVALAAGELEWFAVPATPHGEYVNGGYMRLDVTLADGTTPIDKDAQYVESIYPDAYVAEIGAQRAEWTSFSGWLVGLGDSGPLAVLFGLVDGMPHAVACLFGDPTPQPDR